MALYVYNNMTRKKEEFKAIEENKVKMYACGITVSGDAHIGHARQAVVYDVLRRYLEYKGYEVIYVRNYTDVDDKIIAKANELGIEATAYAESQIKKTDEVLAKLGVKEADFEPKASENIKEMIELTEGLIKKGYAYAAANGDVYFKVESFPEYGKLSGQKIEDNISGVRKDVIEGKKNDLDFALWKASKPGEIFWSSPWGNGRPGWHIECSAMCIRYLGEQVDIHGGGRDLIFPHHENEIAQSEAYTGKKFANYWIHNGMIRLNDQKMSKSIGNVITIQNLLEQYEAEVIRYGLLQFNYQADVNIVDGMFEEVEQHLYDFYKTFKIIDELPEGTEVSNPLIDEIKINFETSMDDDLNTGVAISYLHSYFSTMNKLIKEGNNGLLKQIKTRIINLYAVLGLLQEDSAKFINNVKQKQLLKMGITEAEINEQIAIREEYKKNKDYEKADQVRKELLTKKIVVMDSRDKTEWDIKII